MERMKRREILSMKGGFLMKKKSLLCCLIFLVGISLGFSNICIAQDKDIAVILKDYPKIGAVGPE